VESIPDPDEAENDIKKHFRYVSFNSERNKEDYVSSLISEAVRDISIVENGKAVMKGA
jgi:hypothetical protein